MKYYSVFKEASNNSVTYTIYKEKDKPDLTGYILIRTHNSGDDIVEYWEPKEI